MTTNYEIDEFTPESGRRIKEDGTVINVADEIDSIFNYGLKTIPQTRMLTPIASPVQLTIPTYDGSGQGTEPHVIFIQNGFGQYGDRYWMAFCPYPNSNWKYENISVLSSPDGVNWRLPGTSATNPIQVPSGVLNNPPTNTIAYIDPVIVHEYASGKYNRLACYYNQYDGTNAGTSWRTTSTDGVTWSAPVQTSLQQYTNSAALSFGAPCVVFEQDGQWVAYQKGDYGNYRKSISTDGINFYQYTTITPTNIIGNMDESHYLRDSMGYHVLTSVYPTWDGQTNTRLYYGFSSNGDSFTLDIQPVLEPTLNTWYSGDIYRGSMIQLSGDIWRVYFAATQQPAEGTGDQIHPNWSIGYVDCKLFAGILPTRSNKIARPIWYAFNPKDTTTHYSTDTSNTWSWHFKWHKVFDYANKVIRVWNNTDQSVTFNLLFYRPGNVGWYENVDGTSHTITLTAGQTETITTKTWPALSLKYAEQIAFSCTWATAPVNANNANAAMGLYATIEGWD